MTHRQDHDVLALARSIYPEMVECRRDFHMNPEIGFDVQRTAAVVAQKLNSYGLRVKTGVGKTGVVGDLIVPNATKCIALRADMDALPMDELNDKPYKSKIPLKAHMCGHDAHTAMLLGAAKILASLKNTLKANVRFVFQPSEELFPGGAPFMIKDGVLESVDEIYALHVWPTLPVGHYGICVGPAMAQGDGFSVTINGRGGHAAAPHLTVDPIVISAQIIQSFQNIISRHVDPLDSAVITVAKIHGGTANNVIPDSCTFSGGVRTCSGDQQKFIRKTMEDIVHTVAAMYGAKGELSYVEGYPVTYNHEGLAAHAKEIAAQIVDKTSIDYPAKKMMGGEDFSYYAQKVKGCFIQLGCRNEAKGITHMLHDSRFDIDEDCMVYGTALHIKLAAS